MPQVAPALQSVWSGYDGPADCKATYINDNGDGYNVEAGAEISQRTGTGLAIGLRYREPEIKDQ